MMDADPFPGLTIENGDFLDDLDGRQSCPRCQKSRMFYCYSCFVPLKGTEDRIPRIQLPFEIDIIKHPKEVDGKSTAGHAAVIAPDQVKIYTFPDIPQYKDKSKVLLVYPSKNSLTLKQFVDKYSYPISSSSEKSTVSSKHRENVENNDGKCSVTIETKSCTESAANASEVCAATCVSPVVPPGDLCDKQVLSSELQKLTLDDCDTHNMRADDELRRCHEINHVEPSSECSEHIINPSGEPAERDNRVIYAKTFEKVVFIDSTWHQVKRIYNDERLQGLHNIVINSHESQFWRHQKNKPTTHLSTIEAIYYFLCECHELFEPETYVSQYDNLLFFFVFFYHKIRRRYDGGDRVLLAYQDKLKARNS